MGLCLTSVQDFIDVSSMSSPLPFYRVICVGPPYRRWVPGSTDRVRIVHRSPFCVFDPQDVSRWCVVLSKDRGFSKSLYALKLTVPHWVRTVSGDLRTFLRNWWYLWVQLSLSTNFFTIPVVWSTTPRVPQTTSSQTSPRTCPCG